MAKIVEPVRLSLEERMSRPPRGTATAASRRDFPGHAWPDDDCVRAWRAAEDLDASAVTLCHPRPDLEVLTFPDLSDAH